MTDSESKLAAIEAELRVRGVIGFDSSTWLIAEVRRLAKENDAWEKRAKLRQSDDWEAGTYK